MYANGVMKHLPKNALKAHLPLHTVLENFRSFQATDLRDKAFALYGVTDAQLSTLGLKVDHNDVVVDMFISVMLSITKTGQGLGLDLIAAAGMEGRAFHHGFRIGLFQVCVA